jgi:hypothetical protein
MFPNVNGDDFFLKHNSFKGATDFAQKYLFKSSEEHCDEDNIDIFSGHSSDDESFEQEDSFEEDSYPNETSQGTLDQNELTHPLTISS